MLDLINAIPRSILLPPTSLFLVIAIGLAMWRPWPRAGRVIAGTGLAALTFLSSTAGAAFFVAPLERMTAPVQAQQLVGAQAIVVLAAGRLRNAPEYGWRDIPDFYALARLRYAAHLHRRTGLPVLVSGGHGGHASASKRTASERAYTLADAMASALREDFGVPVQWIERGSLDTAENAVYSAQMLRKDGVERIVLVTDAMHMPRAKSAFERTGLGVIAAPTMFFTGQERGPGAWLPSAEGMRRSWYAVYELLGITWYRLRAPAPKAGVS